MKTTQNRRPSHTVYSVEGQGDSAHWTRLGSGWLHEDGDGLNITLAALPLNGRLVIRTAKQTTAKEAGR